MVHFTTTERTGVFDFEWPAEPEPVFYRLYHDADGLPLFYTMTDEPGTYIEIDQAVYIRSSTRVRVQNGKLTEVAWRTTQKLTPGKTGTACDPRNVAIVTDNTPCTRWSKRTYEAN